MKLLYDTTIDSIFVSYYKDSDIFIPIDTLREGYKENSDLNDYRYIKECDVWSRSFMLSLAFFRDFFNISKEDLEIINNYKKDSEKRRFILIKDNIKLFSVLCEIHDESFSNIRYCQYLFKEKPFVKKIKKSDIDIKEFSEFIYDTSDPEYYKIFIDPGINLNNIILIKETTDLNRDFKELIYWKIFCESMEKGVTTLEERYNKFREYILFFEDNAESNTEITDLEEFYYLYYNEFKNNL